MRICAAGDKYTIPELESLALKNFRSEGLVRWEHVDFAEGIREAYLCSDYPVVRDIVQNVALAAHDALVAKRERYQPFWDVTVQVPEFARDMLLALSLPRHPPVGKRYVRPSCSEVLYLDIKPNERFDHACKVQNVFALPPNCVTEYGAQELFLNAEGKMRGGLAQGFEVDEMPSGNAMGAQPGPLPFDAPGERGSQLGSSILDSSTLRSSVLGKRRKSSIGTPPKAKVTPR